MAVRVPPIPLKDMEGMPLVVLEWFRKLQLNYLTVYSQSVVPTPPAGQFFIYMDDADNRLKAKGPSGTITTLALP